MQTSEAHATHAVSPTISLWEFQKCMLNHLKNVLMKFCENFAMAAVCHYLLLIIPTEFIIILNAYGSIWRFLNFAIISIWRLRRTNAKSIVLKMTHSELE